MASAVETGAKRAAYSLTQMARVGWYSMHYVVGRHLVGPLTKPGEVPFAAKSGPVDLALLQQSFRQLFRDEWNMIDAGIYKLPHDMLRLPNVGRMIRNSRDYFHQARAVAHRAFEKDGHSEVLDDKKREAYPRYYLQNFHYQSDGWLSEESARIYDMQVETLFTGAADAMRRQALPFIRNELISLRSRGVAEKDVTFVDLACGTGRLLSFVRDNFAEMSAVAIDLSPDYLNEAKARLAPWSGVEFLQGKAEDIPLADNSVDMLVNVYLFHELPPKVRQQVTAEIARVLKPGGLYLNVDTIQYGDAEGLDLLLESFPRAFHEPYYDSYCMEDLDALFGAAGLDAEDSTWGFLTKVSAFRKPTGKA
jgi:ubiquinone/menaquinone biosynthesis C-methylase UbiE